MATLPEPLARELMRYHWRMKYLEESKAFTTDMDRQSWVNAKGTRDKLLARLDKYGKRGWFWLVFWKLRE